jgi:glycosyltransferase involved in cell wall biosynthesis
MMPDGRIRVAHLITNFAFGGAQDYLLLIVRGLDRSKFAPIIAGRMEGDWVSQVQTMPDVEWQDIPALRREISPLNDLASVVQIRKFCRDRKIDILHTHSSKAGVVGRLGGSLTDVRAIVHTVHGFSFHNFMPSWKRIGFVTVEKVMSRFTTTLLVYSHGDERTARSLGIGGKKPLVSFYYGIDYAPFQEMHDRQKIRQSLGFDETTKVLGFTGRFSEQKALHVLVEAFAQVHRTIPQTRLLLVGDGQLRQELEAQIDRLGVAESVVITGFREDIPAMLAAMDLFVMTSLWEGLSRSLAEAMYARLPVVATDVGGTSDAVRTNETGWLVPPNNAPATAAAIREVLNDPGRANTLAARGHEWARGAFDVRTMHRRITDLYEGLMADFGKNVAHEPRR